MKRVILAFIGLAGCIQVQAQQRPHYTQYLQNQYILNPALSGIENYTDVKLSMRDQWVGLDGAPRTLYLTVHKPIGKTDLKTSATSFAMPGENPRGASYWESYTASEPHHGIGLQVINDKTGLYNRFSASLSYAYHIGLSPKLNLAAGFAGGIMKIGRDASKSTFSNGDPTDPAEGSAADIYRLRPDLSAGLWLYGADFFGGLSAQQIIPQKVAFTDQTQGLSLVPHIFATAGYRFLVGEDFNLIPSLMLKYVPNTPTSPGLDINAKLQYRDLLWAGAGWRLDDGYSAMVGLNAGNTVNFSYAYDFTRSALNTVSRGTHEMIIGFLIGNRYGDTCPRNVW